MAILWLVDRGSPREGLAALPPDNAANIIIYNERSTTLSQLTQQVRSRVSAPVDRVRIVSHGNSGQLNFSNGVIHVGNADVFSFLRGLVRSHRMGAGIEIHGCGVASADLPPPRMEQGIGNVRLANYGNMQGQLTTWPAPGSDEALSLMLPSSVAAALSVSRGVQFLQRMANVCGVGALGGVNYQLPDTRWEFEGPTITVYPGRSQPSVLSDPHNQFGYGALRLF